MAYQIFIDSSSDLKFEIRKEYNIDYFRMGIVINGEEKYADMDWVDYSPEQLYDWIRNFDNHCKTSLVSIKEFEDKMIPLLEKGVDILYLACTTALSGTLNVFNMVKNELMEKYPNRKIIGVDSSRANMALGMIAIEAAKLQKEGKSIEEVAKWVEEHKEFYHEVGSLETLTYLKAAGRVSGAAAFFGNIIGLKPIIMFDIHGHNFAFKKVRGSKAALQACFDYIKENINENTKVIYVGQAMAKPAQEYFKKRITEELNIPVEEFIIGPIVGISCGPGMYGIYFEGKEVIADSEKK